MSKLPKNYHVKIYLLVAQQTGISPDFQAVEKVNIAVSPRVDLQLGAGKPDGISWQSPY
jgi:hypothetical protein